MKEFLGTRVVASLDQGSDIGVASGNDTVKRSGDSLERLELFEALDICFARIYQSLFRTKITDSLICLLV